MEEPRSESTKNVRKPRRLKENCLVKSGTYFRDYYRNKKVHVDCECGGHFYNLARATHEKSMLHRTFIRIQEMEKKLEDAGL